MRRIAGALVSAEPFGPSRNRKGETRMAFVYSSSTRTARRPTCRRSEVRPGVTWKAGDTIPLGARTLRVVEVRDDDADQAPRLIVRDASG